MYREKTRLRLNSRARVSRHPPAEASAAISPSTDIYYPNIFAKTRRRVVSRRAKSELEIGARD